jgi:hypothetical protein
MYNTEVGYCQGMSEIAALLLMYLNEKFFIRILQFVIFDSSFHSYIFEEKSPVSIEERNSSKSLIFNE